jgi:DNA-binding CsgD family transcriptional regulator
MSTGSGRTSFCSSSFPAIRPRPRRISARRVGLTEREGQVLYWLTKGKANRDIAEILGLGTRTIDKHLQQIYAKLEVENRTSATAIAVQLLSEGGGR